MAASGKLNLAYLRSRLHDLAPGVYELMCHPGACADEDVPNAALRAYHKWGNELEALTSSEFRSLCRHRNISLIGYRHLKIDNGQIELDIDDPEER
jgi:hypothetical protein